MIAKMQRWGLMGLLCLILAAVLVLPQAGGISAWSEDPAENISINADLGNQDGTPIVPDGWGEAAIYGNRSVLKHLFVEDKGVQTAPTYPVTSGALTELNPIDTVSLLTTTPWYNTWGYRQLFAVNGSTDGALSNYQMKLTVNKGNGISTSSNVYLNGHCNNDFSDIRFTKSDGTTLLDYWIESYTSGSNAIVWIELDSIPASPGSTSFYIYYGNASATSASNGDATFKFFDNFLNTEIDTNKWTFTKGSLANGHYSVGSSILEITEAPVALTSAAFTATNNVAFRMRVQTHSKYWRAYQQQIIGANGKSIMNTYTRTEGNGNELYSTDASSNVIAAGFPDNSYDIVDYTMSGEIAYWQSGSKIGSTANTNTVSSFTCGGITDETGQVSHMAWDWVLARNFTYNEPTLGTWGTAESNPDAPKLPEVWVDDNFNSSTPGWGNYSFAVIQYGINNISTPGIVHVADGIYRENIVLKSGVQLLGAGSATIIDGMKKGSVITANNVGSTTILDGFTVTNGGGTYFYGEDAYCGGGMYNNHSSPTITNCTFRNNMAEVGGGMYNYNSSSPTITDCTFRNNSAAYASGGMCNEYYSSPDIINCIFLNNMANDGGVCGGMLNIHSSPAITNCTFRNNLASYIGGMYNYYSSPTITDCIFQNNMATASDGICGGVYNYYSSSTITNCIFRNNLASYIGGMYNYYSSPTITNGIFQNNMAIASDGVGGGMYNSHSSPTITNCILWSNSATLCGGGMYNYNGSSPIITNCILWNDSPKEICNSVSTPVVTYCDVQGTLYPGPGNINASPIFANAAAGDFHLTATSPCINTGKNSAPFIPLTDFEGDPRIWPSGGTVDMGVDEFIPSEVWVDDNFNSSTKGWGYDHFAKIQDGINGVSGSIVHVAAGTYYENIVLVDGVELLGAGSATTIIDGMKNGSVITATNVGNTTVIDGFTVTNGSGTLVNSYNCGGGMFNYNSSLVITNCIFLNNSGNKGGGMYNYNSSPIITNCTFLNTSGNKGGGMYNYNSSAAITSCIFQNNSAESGAGMFNDHYSSPAVTDCIFRNNSATSNGGGMFNDYSSPIITNCTFLNSVGFIGGGMFNGYSSPIINNSNVENNSASYGGGMYNYYSLPAITGCIFQSNYAHWYGGGMYNEDSAPILASCNFLNNVAYQTAASAYAYGGGMYNTNSSPALTECNFIDNMARANGMSPTSAYAYGGGIYSTQGSSPALTNCYFGNNSAYATDTGHAEAGGGGVYTDSGVPQVVNCVFENNSAIAVVAAPDMSAYAWGGGMYIGDSSPVVANCIFDNNYAYAEDPSHAEACGGGIYNSVVSYADITSCTFWSNSVEAVSFGTAREDGGGIYIDIEAQSPVVTNCILWNNSPDQISSGSPDVSYSDIEGEQSYWGTGNINVAPMFTDPANGDFHLTSDSPCIDAGNNQAVPSWLTKDFEDDSRIADGDSDGYAIVDMGVDEYLATPIITWENPADIVYGTALNATQLCATASVPGSFVYTPAAGIVLNAGNNQNLKADFTPADTNNYSTASKTVTINVSKKAITVTAVNKSKVTGAAMPTLTATATGLVSPDTLTSLSLGYTLNTTATAASPVGTYNITITGGAASTANYGPIAYVNGTLTVTSGGGGFGGGGGGDGGGPAPAETLLKLHIDMWDKTGSSTGWLISSQGILQENASQTSLEGAMTIDISKGTKLLNASFQPVTKITVLPIDPPAAPPVGYHVLQAFNFDPDKATFDPGLKITMSFNASGIAPGETVVIATYNEATGKWEFIEGAVIADGVAVFTVTHFSVYAVMYSVPQLTPTPAPISAESDGGMGTGVIVGIVVGVLVVLAAAIWLLMRSRRRTAQS